MTRAGLTHTGLTLTEVLIALIVIAVAFMALASVQISNLSTTRGSQEVSRATQYANKVLEAATLKVFERSSSDYEILKYYNCPESTEVTCGYSDTDDDYPGYTATVTLTGLYQEPASGETRTPEQYRNEGLIEANISVTGPAEVSFTSYISCYDVLQTMQLETNGDPCQEVYKP